MKTYISILRGINVSGKNLIKMQSLQETYEGLGFSNVNTYIQSGNVIFQSKESELDKLERKISQEILKEFSFNVPVLIRKNTELKEIIEENPFKGEDSNKVYITFLSSKPSRNCIENLLQEESATDKYCLKGRTIYLFCLNGYGKTMLTNNYFENKLKVKATTRNFKTVNELLNLSETV